MSKPLLAYLVFLAGAFIWCMLILAAPLLTHAGGSVTAWGSVLYEGFHRICHQYDTRTLHIAGEPLGVCARCSGIYFTFLAGTLCYPLVRELRRPVVPSRGLLVVAVIPMLIDVGLGFAGLHEISTTTRLITGSVFGALIPFVILPVALGAVIERTSSSPLFHQPKGTVDA
jgi:uncharacterized membrane protein